MLFFSFSIYILWANECGGQTERKPDSHCDAWFSHLGGSAVLAKPLWACVSASLQTLAVPARPDSPLDRSSKLFPPKDARLIFALTQLI